MTYREEVPELPSEEAEALSKLIQKAKETLEAKKDDNLSLGTLEYLKRYKIHPR
ncbi:hypothetical protein NECID01_1668 [Nematocida sp. AWRm77]|nr:hypothetical protein NECID01_1668 [Nematocida sp. AWRm77]